jgi:hypothetical protein
MHAAVVSVCLTILFVMVTAGPVLWSAGISGYNEIDQYEEISMYLSANLNISMSAIMLSAVVFGLLGAVMDTAVAITTAVHEVYVNKPELTQKELFYAGLHIGRDILGTTINTLFFAGLGVVKFFQGGLEKIFPAIVLAGLALLELLLWGQCFAYKREKMIQKGIEKGKFPKAKYALAMSILSAIVAVAVMVLFVFWIF